MQSLSTVPLKIHAAQIAIAQVNTAEISTSEVEITIRILYTPLVPLIYAVFQDRQMFGVGHRKELYAIAIARTSVLITGN